MKMRFSLAILVAVLATVSMHGQSRNKASKPNYNAVMKETTEPHVDTNGFFSIEDCPIKKSKVKVVLSYSNDDEYNCCKIKIYIAGSLVAEDTYEDRDQLGTDIIHFVDANFDGYTDIYVGKYAYRSTPSHFLIWNPKKQKFDAAEEHCGVQYVINPSGKYCVAYEWLNGMVDFFYALRWEDGELVVDESLWIIDPDELENWEVKAPFTVFDEDDKVKYSVQKENQLPKKWRAILKSFTTTSRKKLPPRRRMRKKSANAARSPSPSPMR